MAHVMEGRVHNEFDAIKTPVGYIPLYVDLKKLFADIFRKEFSHEMYVRLFSIRVNRYLEKMQRMEKLFKEEGPFPHEMYHLLESISNNLIAAGEKYGSDEILPDLFLK
jgi:phosphoenolpyruvate carboxykinase (GTP)